MASGSGSIHNLTASVLTESTDRECACLDYFNKPVLSKSASSTKPTRTEKHGRRRRRATSFCTIGKTARTVTGKQTKRSKLVVLSPMMTDSFSVCEWQIDSVQQHGVSDWVEIDLVSVATTHPAPLHFRCLSFAPHETFSRFPSTFSPVDMRTLRCQRKSSIGFNTCT